MTALQAGDRTTCSRLPRSDSSSFASVHTEQMSETKRLRPWKQVFEEQRYCHSSWVASYATLLCQYSLAGCVVMVATVIVSAGKAVQRKTSPVATRIAISSSSG